MQKWSFTSCELLTNFVSLHVWNNIGFTQYIDPSLWIADKFCIFARLKQSTKFNYAFADVVNCWQILYLCTSETIAANAAILLTTLWIADKFCIFARLKQLYFCRFLIKPRCELLTNFVSLHVWNNFYPMSNGRISVVNCWQILYLCTSETISKTPPLFTRWLWIADKFCIFARLKQYIDRIHAVHRRCELLTNFVSLHVWNNLTTTLSVAPSVVNCWQILYLCTSETIGLSNFSRMSSLWIADKFCIFARLKQ